MDNSPLAERVSLRSRGESEKDVFPPLTGIFARHEEVEFHKGEGKKTPLTHWFARERTPGMIYLQKLDRNMTPSGRLDRMPRDEFMRSFILEPELWYRLVSRRVEQGDWYRKQSQFVEAKIEYNKALGVDDGNIRAMFGLGLCYLALTELDKASYVFDKLVELDETFEPKHKHLFNEFGISMRKKGMFVQAVQFYSQAIDISADDEHLYLNLARAEYENGTPQAAYESLRKAFVLNPEHPAALAFLRFLHLRGIRPDDKVVAATLSPFIKDALASSCRMEDFFDQQAAQKRKPPRSENCRFSAACYDAACVPTS